MTTILEKKDGKPSLMLGGLFAKEARPIDNRFLDDFKIGAVLVVGAELGDLVSTQSKGQPQMYMHIKALDDPSFRLCNFFQLTREFIRCAIENGLTVLVCCAQGISRSSAVVVDYLVSRGGPFEGRGVASVIRYVQSKRPQVNPNAGFVEQLCDLHGE